MNNLKEVMVHDLELSITRGEKTEALLVRSDDLVMTSINYKTTAKKVKRTFCMRKWKMIIGAIVITVLLILLIWLLIAH